MTPKVIRDFYVNAAVEGMADTGAVMPGEDWRGFTPMEVSVEEVKKLLPEIDDQTAQEAATFAK